MLRSPKVRTIHMNQNTNELANPKSANKIGLRVHFYAKVQII
uniref:Uncharacterized protein n=1 Tax=Rhizophora mucronata TaxID=61149 RepID=A0A2P2IKJ6_RHIMU